MRNPFIKLFVIGFAIAVLVAFSYRNLAPSSASEPSCNVQTGVCESVSGIELSFSGPIEANKPLQVMLTLPEGAKLPVTSLNATLTGQEMYMGITESVLKLRNNSYIGELRIPVCTTETMDWRLAISVAESSATEQNVEPLIYHFSITQP